MNREDVLKCSAAHRLSLWLEGASRIVVGNALEAPSIKRAKIAAEVNRMIMIESRD